ncbi:hypothetical protein [Myxococcus virescens]|uniref:Uncharacterized protein n=1 Tax=Myxococcus virescens TaxID=83456 RepID=A0A511HPC8_9BACT|nr:hypothetical protein [Myxococcus virescens]GEL75446.1 hypothetical protein MVI01_72300 [Myxococcus virescens]SDE53983.1 hypothetical protein SAMN04488504_108120 [Myxococcus virescens]
MTTMQWMAVADNVKHEFQAAGLLAALSHAEGWLGEAANRTTIEVWPLHDWDAMQEPEDPYRSPVAKVVRGAGENWWLSSHEEPLKLVGQPALTELGSAYAYDLS